LETSCVRLGNADRAPCGVEHGIRRRNVRRGQTRGIDRRLQLRVQPQVHAEWAIGQLAHALNLRAQFVGRQIQSRENPQSGQLGSGDTLHSDCTIGC
jgi:hypothetical protein